LDLILERTYLNRNGRKVIRKGRKRSFIIFYSVLKLNISLRSLRFLLCALCG
jgi:hypothetical protein